MKTRLSIFQLFAITLALSVCGILSSSNSSLAAAEQVTPGLQAKLDEKLKQMQEWANSEPVVKAVAQRNTTPLVELASMNQEQWKALTVLSPLLKLFTKNEAADFLKGRKDDSVTEAFLSAANGSKIAFLSKTTNWSHLGKPKHDQPMAGKPWQGNIEVDESTGAQTRPCPPKPLPISNSRSAASGSSTSLATRRCSSPSEANRFARCRVDAIRIQTSRSPRRTLAV